MADIDLTATPDAITVAENVSRLYEFLFTGDIVDGVTLTESLGNLGEYMLRSINLTDTVTAAEDVATPVMAVKLYRGTNAVTVTLVTIDWSLIETYRQFKAQGVPLKGIILIPGSGGPDTFSIKDGSDSGAYLYYGAVSAASVIVYPGSFCKPYIDYSECTLTTGHKVTFVW